MIAQRSCRFFDGCRGHGNMAFIDYVEVPEGESVPDTDNILRIHGVHARTQRLHYDLYRELMYGSGPLTRVQREMIAVVVSAKNDCHY